MLATIANILLQIGAPMFLIGGFILVPIIWIITVPYYDNKVGLKNIYNPILEAFFFPKGLYKAVWYGSFIVIHKGMKKSWERKIYGELDFNHKARLIDKIICYPFFVLFFGGIALIALTAIFLGLAKLASL